MHHGGAHGVGAHGESAGALEVDPGVVQQREHDLADQLGRLVVQRDPAQVDVVVGFGAAGEDDLAADDGQLLDQFKQAGTGGSGVSCRGTGGSHGTQFSGWAVQDSQPDR